MAIYIRCDKCGDTFDGEKHHERGFRWNQAGELRSEAEARGWKCTTEEVENVNHRRGDLRHFDAVETDICPKCT